MVLRLPPPPLTKEGGLKIEIKGLLASLLPLALGLLLRIATSIGISLRPSFGVSTKIKRFTKNVCRAIQSTEGIGLRYADPT